MLVLGSNIRLGEGLQVLSDLFYPYPWWYWTLVIAGSIPIYIGLMYAVFFSRATFVACGRLFLLSKAEQFEYGQWGVQIVAFCRLMLWAGLCIAAVVVQHQMLWSRFFPY